MSPTDTVRVAVFGASGYSGAELLRLLAGHPHAAVVAAGANEQAGKPLAAVHPHLASAYAGLVLEALDASVAERADVAFLALPHGASSALVPALAGAGARVIDLGGDFRLPAEAYPTWYGFEHAAPEWLGKAVYGLPELNAAEIAGARIVANPGCYPTAAALALAPALRAGLVSGTGIVVDAKSGVSGAGAKPTPAQSFAAADGGVRPYKVATHQHTPEIEQTLERVARTPVRVTFVPHVVPTVRGILATCYATLTGDASVEDLLAAAAETYAGAPFVRVLPEGQLPDPKRVATSNACEVGAAVDVRAGTAVLFAAIDNLVKGAAGQAIQNMNLMLGLPETAGLPTIGVWP